MMVKTITKTRYLSWQWFNYTDVCLSYLYVSVHGRRVQADAVPGITFIYIRQDLDFIGYCVTSFAIFCFSILRAIMFSRT